MELMPTCWIGTLNNGYIISSFCLIYLQIYLKTEMFSDGQLCCQFLGPIFMLNVGLLSIEYCTVKYTSVSLSWYLHKIHYFIKNRTL